MIQYFIEFSKKLCQNNEIVCPAGGNRAFITEHLERDLAHVATYPAGAQ
jgi:hypothetical protein